MNSETLKYLVGNADKARQKTEAVEYGSSDYWLWRGAEAAYRSAAIELSHSASEQEPCSRPRQ